MTINPLPELNDTDIELLSAYIDRQLSDAARTLLETRLGQEPALRIALDELRTTVAALQALESVRPPRSFTIDPATVQHPATRWWRSLILPFGGLAAALVVAVVLVGLLRSGSPTRMTVASAPTAAPEATPAQFQAQTTSEQTQAVATEPIAPAAAAPAPIAPAAAAPIAPAIAATTTPAPTSAPAAAAGAAEAAVPTLAAPNDAQVATAAPPSVAPPAAAAPPSTGAAEVAVPTLAAPNDAQVAGDTSANRAAATTILMPTSEPASPLTTPAISSPGTTTLQPAAVAPLGPQTGPPLLPIVLIVVVLIGAIVIGINWMRRRNK